MLVVNKLCKCPFCGGDAWLELNPPDTVWVECKSCHAKSRIAKVSETPTFKTLDEAQAFVYGAWERRTNE